MNRLSAAVSILAAILIVTACSGPAEPASEPEPQTAPAATEQPETVAEPQPESKPEPAVKSTQPKSAIGTLSGLEDGPYPQFVVSITLESGELLELNLNVEAIEQDAQQLYEWIDAKVAIDYEIDTQHYLMALQSEGGKVGSKAIDPSWDQISGVLSGADEPTMSDLPGELTVTAKDGNRVVLDHYVSEEETAFNGKQVTAWYSTREMNNLLSISTAE